MTANEWAGLMVVCVAAALCLAVDLRRVGRGSDRPNSPEREVQRLREAAVREFYEREAAAGRAGTQEAGSES